MPAAMAAALPPVKRQPTEKPPFTVGTLRKAIPAYCFERSLVTSSAYLAADLAGVALLYYCTTFFGHASIPAAVRWGLLWPAYWVLQGAVCTGLWVIAHECGHQVWPCGRGYSAAKMTELTPRDAACLLPQLLHGALPGATEQSCCVDHDHACGRQCEIGGAAVVQAFSKYQTVNDGVGLVVHSCLLVPYYSWCGLESCVVTVACMQKA